MSWAYTPLLPAAAEIEAVPVTNTGYIKVWDGASWVLKPMKYWDGASWVIKPVKYYNGSTWVLAP